MQEEVENRTLTLVVSGTKFTGRMFKAAISKYMAHRKEKKLQKQRSRDAPVVPHGKQTVKQLVGQNQGISNIYWHYHVGVVYLHLYRYLWSYDRDLPYAALLYAGYVRKAWTAPGKDRGQHSQSSCDPSKAATLPDQQLLCRIKAAGNAR